MPFAASLSLPSAQQFVRVISTEVKATEPLPAQRSDAPPSVDALDTLARASHTPTVEPLARTQSEPTRTQVLHCAAITARPLHARTHVLLAHPTCPSCRHIGLIERRQRMASNGACRWAIDLESHCTARRCPTFGVHSPFRCAVIKHANRVPNDSRRTTLASVSLCRCDI
jgi:hypothetical protein